MKRATLWEMRQVAKLPTFNETIRPRRGAHGEVRVSIHCEEDQYSIKPILRVLYGTAPVGAVELYADELRRLAEIKDALAAWEIGAADWPVAKVTP